MQAMIAHRQSRKTDSERKALMNQRFVQLLQEAAEKAGKEFDPAVRTEEELGQLYQLYLEEGIPLEEFAGRFL